MATLFATLPAAELRERRFFLVMACVLAALVFAGFGFNLAMGRSTLAVPAIFHVHALFFVGWVALYVAQNALAYANNLGLHRALGLLALVWLPILVVLGLAMTITSIRMTGGPSFFGVSEFLFVNTLHIAGFAALTGVAIGMWRRTDWHRRLMLSGMALIAAPGIARLLPSPLFVPYTFAVIFAVSALFPLFGLAADLRRSGRVHPAWLWGIGAMFAVLIAGEALGASAWGKRVTAELIAGTPGAERPFEAFMPG